MPKPKHPNDHSWMEQYWRLQLRAAESRQKWLWGNSPLPELGLLLRLFTFGFGVLLFPVRVTFNVWRRHKKRQAFRSYLRGEDSR